MKRRRFYQDPVIWLIFAAAVSMPAAELARLIRAPEESPNALPVPDVAAAGDTFFRRLDLPAVEPAGSPTSSIAPASEPVREPASRIAADAAPVLAADPPPNPGHDDQILGPTKVGIAAAAISPSGRFAAMLDDSGQVSVWDTRTRKQISAFASGQRPPMNFLSGPPLALTEPRNAGETPAMIVTGDDAGYFRARGANGSDLLVGAHGLGKSVRSTTDTSAIDVAITPTGAIVSASTDRLELWTPGPRADSALRWVTAAPASEQIRDIDVSPDGQTIAVATQGGLYFVDAFRRTWTLVDTSGRIEWIGDERARADGSGGRRRPHPAGQVRFSPRGDLVAAAGDSGAIRVYSVAERKRRYTFVLGELPGRLRKLAFSPDGTLLAFTDGHRVVHIWSMAPGQLAQVVATPRGPIRSLWFAPDGRSLVVSLWRDKYLHKLEIPIAAGFLSGPLRVWTRPDSSRYAPVGLASTRIAASTRAARGDLAAVLEESGRVTLWNLGTHKQVASFDSELQPAANFSGSPPPIELLPLAPGDTSPPLLAIGGLDGRVHVWNPLTGAKLLAGAHTVKDSALGRMTDWAVSDVAWTGLSQVASVGGNWTVASWRVTEPAHSALSSKARHPGPVSDIDYNIANDLMAVASRGGLHLVRSSLPWTLVDTSGAETDAEYRARVSAAEPNARLYRNWGTYPYKVTFGPGASLVASVWSNKEIRVHSISIPRQRTGSSELTLTPVRTMRMTENWSRYVTFSPDGKLVAATGDKMIYVWSLTPDTEPLLFPVQRGSVNTLWFTPDGRRLVFAGGGDRHLREIVLPD